MTRALASIVVALSLAPVSAQPNDSNVASETKRLSDLFAYDASAPLEAAGTMLFETDGIAVHDVTFASPRGGRVTALLVVPPGRGPFAGILFGHWGSGTKTEFLPEAILYARAGAVCLLVDYPWVRPAPWWRGLKYLADPANDRELYVRAVVDLRRGIDFLLSRGTVDATRLAYVGHSYGAQWGAILAAVDRRPGAYVLAGGVPDGAAIWLESDEPSVVEARASVAKDVLDRYVAELADLDAIRYVARAAPAPVLFQFARFEQFFGRSAMERYAAAAQEPKSVQWYDTGHDLNDPRALIDRAAWLRQRIRIRPVRLPR